MILLVASPPIMNVLECWVCGGNRQIVELLRSFTGWSPWNLASFIYRVIHEGYTINRYDDDVGRYYGVKHKSEKKQNHPHYPADRWLILCTQYYYSKTPRRAQEKYIVIVLWKYDVLFRFKLLRVAEERISRDGINTAKYQVLNITKEKLFTRIYIDVEQDVVSYCLLC